MSDHYYCTVCNQHYDRCTCASEAKGRVLGKLPVFGMPYGSKPPREPSESSSGGVGGGGAGSPAASARQDVTMSIVRGDGLSIQRKISSLDFERVQWPEDMMRLHFSKMLSEFMDADRQMREQGDGSDTSG